MTLCTSDSYSIRSQSSSGSDNGVAKGSVNVAAPLVGGSCAVSFRLNGCEKLLRAELIVKPYMSGVILVVEIDDAENQARQISQES
jgi:hypothetical protein